MPGPAMTEGYIRLHRKIEDDEFWLTETFTKSQAWIDLLLGANHKPGNVVLRDMTVHLKMGQLAWSQLTMCKRWKWSRGRVKRYLKLLQKIERILVQQVRQHSTLVTICNYKKYQLHSTTGETKTVPEAGHKQERVGIDSIVNTITSNSIYPTIMCFHEEVIADLNKAWGKRYHPETYGKKITALQKKGYTLEDFKSVHRKMKKKWENDPKMSPYLRPKTIYLPENFDSYLNLPDSVPGTPLKATRANLDQRNRNTADEIRRKYLEGQQPSNPNQPTGDVRQLPAGSDGGHDGNVERRASGSYSQPDRSSDPENNQNSFL